jgi:hypothetical protein
MNMTRQTVNRVDESAVIVSRRGAFFWIAGFLCTVGSLVGPVSVIGIWLRDGVVPFELVLTAGVGGVAMTLLLIYSFGQKIELRPDSLVVSSPWGVREVPWREIDRVIALLYGYLPGLGHHLSVLPLRGRGVPLFLPLFANRRELALQVARRVLLHNSRAYINGVLRDWVKM